MKRRAAALVATCLLATLLAPTRASAVSAPPGWPVPYLSPRLTGLDQPVFVTGDGTGQRTYVVERPGRIRVQTATGGGAEVFLDLTAKTTTEGERGLLGLAFSPDYASSGRLYVVYTDRDGDIVLARYVRDASDPDVAQPGSEQVVLSVEHSAWSNHNGGWIAFGPDGYLYVAIGDGGGSGDPAGNAQDRSVLLGKLLRIDVETGDPATYVVPPSNPFVGVPGVRPEIWAWGLRNPWRNSFASDGTLYIADVGQGAWEELDVVAPGASGDNFGWNRWEGPAPYPPGAPAPARSGFTFPQVSLPHPTARSITGGHRYEGVAFPGMRGTYLFGDFVLGTVWGVRRTSSGSWSAPVLAETDLLLSSFGTDDAGEFYACSFGDGTVYRVGDAAAFSRRLAGSDRYDTAVAIARDTHPGWSGVSDVVIASGEDRAAADPLAAAGLCWTYDAPLLLVASTRTPASVRTALTEMSAQNGPLRLHIVGGRSSVPFAREVELLEAAGAGAGAARLADDDTRWEVAASIAREMKGVRPEDVPARALIANGANPSTFNDALALSAVTAGTGAPILLATRTDAPAETVRALEELGLAERWAAGGPVTLSPGLLASLGIAEERRLAGSDRYATAAEVARTAVGRGWLAPDRLTLAAALPDAVAGGASAGTLGGPLLVVPKASLGPRSGAGSFIAEHAGAVTDARVLGGPDSVDDDLRRELALLLER